MSQRIILFGAILLVIAFLFSCKQKVGMQNGELPGFPELSGPYYGQKPPTKRAEMFANELLSVGMNEVKISFSPDGKEFLVNVMTQKGQLLVEPMGVFGKGYTMYSKIENGYWTEPIEFLLESGFRISYPFFSPDGQRLFFNSHGSIADTSYNSQLAIWYVERVNGSWNSSPHEIKFGDAYQGESGVYPSVASNGNLYFAVFPDGINGVLHLCKYNNGKYSVPERLSEVINEVGGNHPFIAPDESYILYDSDLKDPKASCDLYISFRDKAGNWEKPQRLGNEVNTRYDERRPFVSFNGKYLFFASDRINPEIPDRPMKITELQKHSLVPANSQQHLFWVDAKVIEEFDPRYRSE